MRHARSHLTHMRILESATELFTRQGVSGTTITEIARAAKVSRAAFYQHFAGKDAVLREMMRMMWDDGVRVYTCFSELPDWTESAIHDWIDEYFERAVSSQKQYQLVGKVLANEISGQSPAREERNIEALIGNSKNWGRFAPDEARRRARLLIYQLERVSLDIQNGHHFMTEREPLIRTLTDIWVATLKSPRQISK